MSKILRLADLTESEQQKVFDDNYLDEYEFAALEDAFDAKVQKNGSGTYSIDLNLASIDFVLNYTKPYYLLKDHYDLSQTIYDEHKNEIEDLSLTAMKNLFADLCNLIKEYNFNCDDADVETFDCVASCYIQDLSDLYDVLVNVISIKGEFKQLLKKYTQRIRKTRLELKILASFFFSVDHQENSNQLNRSIPTRQIRKMEEKICQSSTRMNKEITTITLKKVAANLNICLLARLFCH